jgi:hypothetical protein
MEKDHFSRECDDAPMHAIHGTEHLRNIGRPASHGCARPEPENARVLFDMVMEEGVANVKVVLFAVTGPGSPPNGAVARRAPDYGQRPGYVSPHDEGDDNATGSVAPAPRRSGYDYRAPPPWGASPRGPDRDYFPPPPLFGPPPGWR